ncbi:MAG: protein translocase subunit SecD [Clostridia bacterium]|nr:protein translocase subunit SecD [Clostridia bacterium]
MFKNKRKSTLIFFISILIIGALAYVSLFGLGDFSGILDEGGINKGLDLIGGSLIVYEAELEEEPENFASDMEAAKTMLRSRLDTLGYTEATIVLVGDRRLQVEIPNIADPEEAVQKLGATAKLEFRNSEGTVVLTGADIEEARQAYGDASGDGFNEYYVALKLKKDAVDKFYEATKYVITLPSADRYIAIYLDEEELSSPHVSKALNTADLSITGYFDDEDSKYLAEVINAGNLPFSLKEIQLKSVGPSLGERAFDTSLLAGGIGILMVMLFMIIIYRLPGIVACISLTAYSALFFIIICTLKINLSLSGIAGIVLSIGMAVDANVVIFERIKEELRAGKSTTAAVISGFKNALSAVVDSNITTIIAAVVLWYFGVGSVQGFAVTLLIGVLLSMFTAVFLTRFLLYSFVGMRITKVSLYGVKADVTESVTGKEVK